MMEKNGAKYFVFVALWLIVCQAKAQVEVTTHLEAGRNNVSESILLNSAIFGTIYYGKYSLKGGYQASFVNPYLKILNAGSITAARQFVINDALVKLEGIYINNRFSEYVREVNWGVVCNFRRNHFRFSAGTNFRIYSVPKAVSDSLENVSNDKIYEYWNLMYLVGYTLKPFDYKWNLGINLTNIDHFIINQETNPGFNIQARYRFSRGLTAYTEAWLKRSGALNLSVNHFGFIIRLGVIWDMDI
ncbi:MAG: hypothetical protein JXR41_13725 [Bacteroidales bacterium]|nr:hypothetical protein [Bacteroidales bacterium]MBN2764146.1 hypothetical protein [Bacteroidales bacterium]